MQEEDYKQKALQLAREFTGEGRDLRADGRRVRP